MDEERTDLDREGIPDHGSRSSGDPEERSVPPSDEPQADGTTAEEQREGLSLDERLEGETSEDPRPRRVRRLGETTGELDDEKDLVAEEGEEAAGPTAEEEAVRVDEDAPGGTSGPDRYVEE
jgi:hypothetical protein